MRAPLWRCRLFLLKYARRSSGVGSRMETDTASASGARGAWKLNAWRVSPAVTAFGLLALLFAWQWYDGYDRIGALRDELAQRVRESESDSRDARFAARQAQEAAREVQAKLAQIELKFAEFQNQQIGLEALYQELSQSRRMGDRRNRADPHHCLAATAAHRERPGGLVRAADGRSALGALRPLPIPAAAQGLRPRYRTP